jgi:hypothetical protein
MWTEWWVSLWGQCRWKAGASSLTSTLAGYWHLKKDDRISISLSPSSTANQTILNHVSEQEIHLYMFTSLFATAHSLLWATISYSLISTPTCEAISIVLHSLDHSVSFLSFTSDQVHLFNKNFHSRFLLSTLIHIILLLLASGLHHSIFPSINIYPALLHQRQLPHHLIRGYWRTVFFSLLPFLQQTILPLL